MDERRRLYDLLLEDINTKNTQQARARRDQTSLHHKQRLILDKYLNGNLDEANIVVHYTTQEVSRDDILQEFQCFVVPTLLPGPCPVLNRSKQPVLGSIATCSP